MQYETISVWWDGEGDMLWVNLADGEGDMVRTKDGNTTMKVDAQGNVLGFYIFGISKRAMQNPINIELVPEIELERQMPTVAPTRPVPLAAESSDHGQTPKKVRPRLNELRYPKDGRLEGQGAVTPKT